MTPHGGAEFRDGTHLEDGPDHGAPDTTNESLQETGSAGPYESSGSASKTMPKIPIANTKPVPFDLAPPWPRTSSQSFLLLHPPEHLPKLKISDHQTTSVIGRAKQLATANPVVKISAALGLSELKQLTVGPARVPKRSAVSLHHHLHPWPRTPTPPLLLLQLNRRVVRTYPGRVRVKKQTVSIYLYTYRAGLEVWASTILSVAGIFIFVQPVFSRVPCQVSLFLFFVF